MNNNQFQITNNVLRINTFAITICYIAKRIVYFCPCILNMMVGFSQEPVKKIHDATPHDSNCSINPLYFMVCYY